MHGIFIPSAHRVHVLCSGNSLILLVLINRRNDAVSTGRQLICRKAFCREFSPDLLHEIAGRAFHRRTTQGIGVNGLWELSSVCVCLRNPTVLNHQVDDALPTRACFLFIDCRIPRRRSGDDPGDHCGLGKGEILCFVTEVSLRCGFDTVGTATKVNGVEVVANDLVLGLLTIDLESKDRFLGFTHITGRFADVVALNILLGQGRRTLARPTPNIVDQRATDTFEVDTGVRVESAILRGNHGVCDIVRQGTGIDDLPIHLRHPAHLGGAIGVVDGRRLCKSNLIRLRNLQRSIGNEEGTKAGNNEAEEGVEGPSCNPCCEAALLLPLGRPLLLSAALTGRCCT